LIDFYNDNAPLPDPYFGLAGLDLQWRILPALCGPFGRILPETNPEEDPDAREK